MRTCRDTPSPREGPTHTGLKPFRARVRSADRPQVYSALPQITVAAHSLSRKARRPVLRKGLALSPANANARVHLATALIVAKQRGEALKVAALLPPDNFDRLTFEAIATATTDRAASNKALAALERSDAAAYQIAEVHAQRGERELAFTAIARAWDGLDPGLTGFNTDPLLAPLRPDPRFGEWLRKIGFP